MKAAVYHGRHDLRVEEVEVREPGEREVLIRVRYCGVCGTDMHIYNGDGGCFEVTPPLIPGHEFSGIVEKVGSAVTRVRPGDRVSVDPNDMCGECAFCRSGKQHFCTNNIGIGTTVHGGFAQFVTVREKQVYKVSQNVGFMEAAMAEPISCCLHGIDLCRIGPGSTVLVMGGGPIGMIMLQLARMAGASTLIMSEPVPEKREQALRLGADVVIDPIREDVADRLASIGKNVDTVIECVGNTRTQADALEFAGNCATVMYFGLAGPDDHFPLRPDLVFKKELTITSSFINPYTFERAIRVLESGRLTFDGIITNVVPLDDITNVFTDAEYRRTGKVMIRVGEAEE